MLIHIDSYCTLHIAPHTQCIPSRWAMMKHAAALNIAARPRQWETWCDRLDKESIQKASFLQRKLIEIDRNGATAPAGQRHATCDPSSHPSNGLDMRSPPADLGTAKMTWCATSIPEQKHCIRFGTPFLRRKWAKIDQNSAASSCIQASLAKTSVSLQVVSPLSCQHIRAFHSEHKHGKHGTKCGPEMG